MEVTFNILLRIHWILDIINYKCLELSKNYYTPSAKIFKNSKLKWGPILLKVMKSISTNEKSKTDIIIHFSYFNLLNKHFIKGLANLLTYFPLKFFIISINLYSYLIHKTEIFFLIGDYICHGRRYLSLFATYYLNLQEFLG